MRRLLHGALLALLAISTAPAQDHRSAQYWYDRACSERDGGKLADAIVHYGNAITLALKRGEEDLAAKALVEQARCHEISEPENADAALAAYNRVVAECANQQSYVAFAQEKIKRKGVDIYLAKLKIAAREWRDTLSATNLSAQDFKKAKTDADAKFQDAATKAWDTKIKPLGADAVYGMIASLETPPGKDDEPQVRAFISQKLVTIIDGTGVALLIGKLDAPSFQKGAPEALQVILESYSASSAKESEAKSFEDELNRIAVGGEKPQKTASDYRDQIAKLRELAAALRYKLPSDLATDEVCGALAKVISNEAGSSDGRTFALEALTSLGHIPDTLVDAVIKALGDTNGRVRESAAMVAGKVNPEKAEDKHKLADQMMKMVTYQSEKDGGLESLIKQIETDQHPELQTLLKALSDANGKGDKDAIAQARKAYDDRRRELVRDVTAMRANSPTVREKCALALGDIGLIKACPALIDALEDNSETVRRAAIYALIKLTELKIAYDPIAPSDAAAKAARVQQIRDMAAKKEGDEKDRLDKKAADLEATPALKEGKESWKKWWDDSHGIEVIVNRFANTIAKNWPLYRPEKLYDSEEFVKRAEARKYLASDPAKEMQRVNEIVKRFNHEKELQLRDAVDAGVGALAQLVMFAHGKALSLILDKPPILEEQREPNPMEAIRLFVAEALAGVAEKENQVAVLRDIVTGAKMIEAPNFKDEAKAGLALALGDLSNAGADDVSALESGLRDAADVVREACARALGRVGTARSARSLLPLLKDKNWVVRRTAAQSIGKIGKRNPPMSNDKEVMSELGALIYDENFKDPKSEKKDTSDEVREYVCLAFGDIADSGAAQYLLRARRDRDANVREAAAKAFKQIVAKDPKVSDQLIAVIVKDERQVDVALVAPYLDRQGAALALGETGDASKVQFMGERLAGAKEDRDKRDPHQTVRAGFATALGRLNVKTRGVIQALIWGCNDETEEVREESWKALLDLTGPNSPLAGIKNDRNNNTTFNAKVTGSEELRSWFQGKFREWFESNKDKFPENPR